ncbi:MAG: histone deacetylase, partial [Elusimicrobia bacterium]|nr:histone deacetylase [Elusimicrobiota bacterium]
MRIAAPRLVFSPDYAVDIGGHVFPTRKFALAERLLPAALERVEPPLAGREELLLAHDPAWVDKVLDCRMTLDDEALMELPFSPEVSRAHRRAAGGTILACRDALERGSGLHCGGGSHHAFADHGEGFCVLNDIALGILQMRREGRLSRAAVIDLDVHQGNGTAAIFAGDPDVFTFSMHQDDLYPAVKPPSSLDVALPAGTGDRDYLGLLEKHLPRVFQGEPELVVYQAGVDCHESDRLGALRLTAAGLERRDRLVREACRERGVPAAVTLGGGYAASADETAALHARTLEL